MKKIYTENPETDLWRELLRFSYGANVRRYLEKKGLPFDETVVDCIVSSFLQAYEYFTNSNLASLHTKPLLLYYGTSNLLNGMVALLTGSIPKIHNHGIKVSFSENNDGISDSIIKFHDEKNGGINVFRRALDVDIKLTETGEWKFKEILSWVAEIKEDFESCYSKDESNVLFIDCVKTPDGEIEKIYENDSEDNHHVFDTMKKVARLDENYLNIQTGCDSLGEYYILRRKMKSIDIREQSFSGKPYFRAAIKKQGHMITLPTLLVLYIALFVLGYICRYKPEMWGPFVLSDDSGERLMFDKFMYYSRRMIPNIVLDIIMGEKYCYVNEQYLPEDRIKLVSEHDVKALVANEVSRELNLRDIIRR